MVEAQVFSDDVVRKFTYMSLTNRETRKAIDLGAKTALKVVQKSVRTEARKVLKNGKYKKRPKNWISRVYEKSSKGVSVSLYRRAIGGSVGINKSFKPTKFSARYFGLFLVECGTSDVIGRNNRHHKATEPQPFFNKGVVASKPKAVAELDDDILGAIDTVLAKRR